MESIKVDYIGGTKSNKRGGIIEIRFYEDDIEIREEFIEFRNQVMEDLAPIESGMGVAFPGIHENNFRI